MIVWGGCENGNDLNTGAGTIQTPIPGRYQHRQRPVARESHTAVWTGSEMIIWGGVGCGGNCRLNTGADTIPIQTHGPLSARSARLRRDGTQRAVDRK